MQSSSGRSGTKGMRGAGRGASVMHNPLGAVNPAYGGSNSGRGSHSSHESDSSGSSGPSIAPAERREQLGGGRFNGMGPAIGGGVV